MTVKTYNPIYKYNIYMTQKENLVTNDLYMFARKSNFCNQTFELVIPYFPFFFSSRQKKKCLK